MIRKILRMIIWLLLIFIAFSTVMELRKNADARKEIKPAKISTIGQMK